MKNIAKKSGILWFTGNTYDVLDRHYRCAIKFDADPIIRITGDCPLIDPFLIEKMIKFYLTHKYDYVANNVIATYPDGLDCQIVSFRALEKEWKIAKWKSEREHVMRYITNNPKKFKIFSYENDLDLSKHRWSIDEANDLKLVRKIYSKLKPKTIFSMKAILKVIKENPQLQEINKGIIRDEGYLLSVKKDRRIK